MSRPGGYDVPDSAARLAARAGLADARAALAASGTRPESAEDGHEPHGPDGGAPDDPSPLAQPHLFDHGVTTSGHDRPRQES